MASRFNYDDDMSGTQNLWIVALVIGAMVGAFMVGRYVIGEKLKGTAAPVRNVRTAGDTLRPVGRAADELGQPDETSGVVSIVTADDPNPLSTTAPAPQRALDSAIGGEDPRAALETTQPEMTAAERRRQDEAERKKAEEERRKKEEAEEERRQKAAEERRKKEETERARAGAPAEPARPAERPRTTERPAATPAPTAPTMVEGSGTAVVTGGRPQPRPAELPDEVKPEPAATPVPETRLYRVRAGTFGDRAAASAREQELRDKGLQPIVKVRQRGGQTVYDVQVGAFTSQSGAQAQAQDLKASGVSATVSED